MKTAVVTGATGFIGKNLCARLKADGWRVIAIAGRTVAAGPWDACFAADLSKPDSVSALAGKLPAGVTAFFHLAGKAHALSELNSDGSEYFAINTEGTRRLLELAKACGARRFVFASTVKAMGEGGYDLLDENFVCAPETPYGRSKLEAEKILFTGNFVPEPVAIRLTMVYGGKDRGNMTRMVDAVRRHRFPPFPETGNRRSMVHIDDAVRAFVLAATHPAAPGGVFIVTDGNLYSTREIYLTIRRALGRGVPCVTPPLWAFRCAAKVGDLLGKLSGRRMPLDTDSLSKLTDSAAYSNERIRLELGFIPEKTLEDGVRAILLEL